jgi:hypothetical protein
MCTYDAQMHQASQATRKEGKVTYRQPKRDTRGGNGASEQRRLVIRSVRYRELDAKKFARALIQMATAEAEAAAQAQHEATKQLASNDSQLQVDQVDSVSTSSSKADVPKEVA